VGGHVDIEREKRAAADAAAALVDDGMLVGLGTGTTVAYLLPVLAARDLEIRCVATSPGTEQRARAAGLRVIAFEGTARLDLAIDGADQVDPNGWLVKGAGGAQTRERIVAAAADRFVVIVSSNKLVEALAPPVPLELLAFGLAATLRAVGEVELRNAPPSPDGGVIADYRGPVGDPGELAERLAHTPGVVSHGLFEPALVSDVLIARGDEVERRAIGRRPQR
jgi:ribose 5-phosphate isomerase A